MRPRNADISPERLREVLDYSADAGIFTWSDPSRMRPDLMGKIAGTIRCGYRVICVDGIYYPAHRLAWLYVFGKWPGDILDHINGVKDDNRIDNLREASTQENARNSKARSALGIKGVYTRPNGRFYAEIRIGGRTKCLGTFDTVEEASAKFAAAATVAHGEFMRLR